MLLNGNMMSISGLMHLLADYRADEHDYWMILAKTMGLGDTLPLIDVFYTIF